MTYVAHAVHTWLAARDWLSLFAIVGTLAGVVYNARRSGMSSDRAQQIAVRVRQEELTSNANTAENSGFTRAQEMVKEAADVQRAAFEQTIAGMREQLVEMAGQMADLKMELAKQAAQIHTQHDEIRTLQETREKDRRTYTRYIQKLLDLLQQHQIAYPAPPPFFDQED